MLKKRRRKKIHVKSKKPIESLFEPNVNWRDVKKYHVIDIIEIVIETEYEVIDEKFTDTLTNPRKSQEIFTPCTN
jgi:hypothetical protein